MKTRTLLVCVLVVGRIAACAADSYDERVNAVVRTPGLVAFWDFVQRTDGIHGKGNFIAHAAKDDARTYELEPHNISVDFWREGDAATLADFPLLGRGPFGQAVNFHTPKNKTDLPVLEVPRAAFHDSPLDVKGPGKSVTMLVWLVYQSGNHAIAGIWHEGTDTPGVTEPAPVQQHGARQFALFAGLAANSGGASAHISENGRSSFGDKYARHLAATSEKMKAVSTNAADTQLDAGWTTVGFVFNSDKKDVAAYLDGKASESWIENPAKSPFYNHAARAWQQAKLDAAGRADPKFPRDQFYSPPETTPLDEKIISETADERIVERTFDYTKVRSTLRRTSHGNFEAVADSLVALKANPYWFGRDIYAPPSIADGGPFTIGRVIHSNRHATLSAWIGGVAVFNRALTAAEMSRLSAIGRDAPISAP